MTVTGQADAWQASIASDVAVLKQGYTGLHADVANLGSKIDALASQVATSQKTNWPLILAAAALTGTIIGGGWTVMDLQNRLTVSESVSPLRASISASESERKGITDRVDRLSTALGEIRERTASLEAMTAALETEQETQFRAIDNTVNSDRAESFRLLGMLWNKTFGINIPTFWHAPEIGRER